MSADPDRTLDFRPDHADPSPGAAPAPHFETAEVARGAETVGMNPPPPPPPPPVDPALLTFQAGPVDEQRSSDWSTPSVVPFPGFELGDEVGRGAVGVVYQARDAAHDRTVALKVLLEAAPDARALGRFRREAEAVERVRHENVVAVYGHGEAAGRPYLVMEFCPNGTLTERLAAAPAGFPPDAAAELIRKVARGVAAAHAAGVVHRDIKPGNVLFDAAGEPKVSDFGLAKSGGSALQLTVAGDIMGTPAYMAPEQAAGEAKGAGPQADVWSLGVILYECLTGFRPFTGRNNIAVLAAVQAADPDPVRKLAPRVHPDLARVCHRCLEKDPKDRYADAGELAAALSLVLAGLPLPDRAGRFRWWHLAAAGAVVAGLSAGGWWLTRPDPTPPPDSGGRTAPAEPGCSGG
ncbi:MAG: hypothetical protein C0501_23360 [Isosphaera sp.]|nr:hypothetical protein [Isosphaera sp.]